MENVLVLYSTKKRVLLLYSVDIIKIEESFLVQYRTFSTLGLYRTIYNMFCIDLKNHFTMQRTLKAHSSLSVHVLYRTILFTKEPLKNHFFKKTFSSD